MSMLPYHPNMPKARLPSALDLWSLCFSKEPDQE